MQTTRGAKAEKDLLRSDPLNLLVNTSVGMWKEPHCFLCVFLLQRQSPLRNADLIGGFFVCVMES